MDSNSADSVSRSERRYWRRKEAADGWWPWGILPLVGLLALFLYGWFQTAPAIEAQTQESVVELLQSQGVDVRRVETDGTRIRIDAAAGQYDAAQIKALSKGTECATWAGQLVCPSAVEVNLLSDETPSTQVASQPVVSDPRYHGFRFDLGDGDVTLNGEVADEQTRSQIVSQAESRFGRVIDRLSVSGDTATPQYRTASAQALDTLQYLGSGSASWSEGRFSATGTVSPERKPGLQSLLEASELAPGELSFRTVRNAANCNEALAAALQQSSINFRTGSTEIESTSRPLLQHLAGLARECPGELTIAGHTDDVGDAEMNLTLSESRAAAVRDALTQLGVVAQRLRVRGYGESQPVADNGSREGRAQNRRIEIQLSENVSN